jgi:hypothetical protein
MKRRRMMVFDHSALRLGLSKSKLPFPPNRKTTPWERSSKWADMPEEADTEKTMADE